MITIHDQKMKAIVNKNKGFTLTEMVIVIAVIAILAAVLIPTFIGISNKAKLSADVQTAKNATTLASGLTDMQEIYDAVANNAEETKKVDLFKTQYAKCFAYEANSQTFVLLNDKYEIIENDTIKNQASKDLWLFAKDNSAIAEADALNSCKVSYFLCNNYSGSFAFKSLVGFNTGNSTLTGNVTYGAEGAITANPDYAIKVSGTIDGTVYVNAPSANFEQQGYIKNLEIKAVKSESFVVKGRIGNVKLTTGRLAVKKGAYVQKVNVPAGANNVKLAVEGYVSTLDKDTSVDASTIVVTSDGGAISNNEAGADISGPTSNIIQIADLAALESFRDEVNAGTDFKGMIVRLENDIRLNDGWTPIGAFSRNDGVHRITKGDAYKSSFAGTFDGNNKTISNLNSNGFNVNATSALGSNETTLANKQEYAYGLFGVVTSNDSANPVRIMNLTISNPQIDIAGVADSLTYGDSVAALVGFISGYAQISNVTVTGGTIKAHDAVGGIVGRISDVKTNSLIIANCSSNANIVANCKAGGILGVVTAPEDNGCTITINGCQASGNVTVTPTFDPDSETDVAGIIGMVWGKAGKVLNLNIQDCIVSGTIKTKNPQSTKGAFGDVLVKIRTDYVNLVEHDNNTTAATVEVSDVIIYPAA